MCEVAGVVIEGGGIAGKLLAARQAGQLARHHQASHGLRKATLFSIAEQIDRPVPPKMRPGCA